MIGRAFLWNDGCSSHGSPAGSPAVITVGASTRDGSTDVEALEITAPASVAERYAALEAAFTPLNATLPSHAAMFTALHPVQLVVCEPFALELHRFEWRYDGFVAVR